jgi:hypothetical protein
MWWMRILVRQDQVLGERVIIQSDFLHHKKKAFKKISPTSLLVI